MDKSEILVHISAPSGAADDARYRAQVEAILNFQAHSRETITLDRADNELSRSAPPEETDTIGDTPIRGQVLKHVGHVLQKDSLESPVSVIPDSQPQQQLFNAESLRLHPVPALSQSPTSKRPRVGTPPLLYQSVHGFKDGDSTTNANPSLPSITAEEKNKQEQDFPPPKAKDATQTSSFPFSLPLEIKPPPPPISTSLYTTHVTPTLQMLAHRLKSPRTYSPTSQTRDLDNLERGYWYLRIHLVPVPVSGIETTTPTPNPDPNSWTVPLFTKFWTFLSDFIAKESRAGWGVWCILEEEEKEKNETLHTRSLPTEEEPIEPDKHSLSQSQPLHLTLKVYTWGEIASHVYLLLFLASDRRTRKMGAQWRDARDEVVIQML
ncbi:hypothetical protein BJX70DRAFT_184127 [Aspergillus crustosus]